jgi:hypothetical protein
LLATILADASNLGLTRMAAASQGVTRDQLIWTADAYIRPETYKAALARIINAHHTLPIAAIWGDGSTSSSDGQFFRSAKRGDAAGEINARYGHADRAALARARAESLARFAGRIAEEGHRAVDERTGHRRAARASTLRSTARAEVRGRLMLAGLRASVKRGPI